MSDPSDEAVAARMLDLTSRTSSVIKRAEKLVGSFPHEEWSAADIDNELRRHEAVRPPMIPLPRMNAWEKGRPEGEGQAGDYLRHLRAAREAGTLPQKPLSGDYLRQFAFRHGSGKAAQSIFDKELSPMPEPVSITITVSAPDAEQLMEAVLDLAEYDDITVQVYRRPQIVHGDDQPEPTRAPMARVHIDRDRSNPTAIETYLVNVCQHNAELLAARADLDARIKVLLDYEAEGTGERTCREAVPFRIETRQQSHYPYTRRSYLVLLDTRKNAVRSFLVDNIFGVDGPAL